VQIRDSAGTTIGGLYLNSNGTLTLKNVATSTTIGTSSALSTNTLYRVGIRQASGSGTGALQAYLASGDAAFGAVFASSSAETISNSAAEVRIGATNSTAVDATVDDIRLDSAAMPGPSTGGSATATPTLTPTPTNTPVGPTATPTLTPTPAPAAPPPYDETYAYDAIGNMSSKAGVNYTYGPTNSGPHQARNVGGQTYSYDANGNMVSGAGRTYTWTADNLPATVNGETYLYDADGERVAKTVGSTTTVYFQGIWEQVVGGASKLYYTFNGQVVAMRDTSANTVTYLHGDHLGSVSLATNSSGAVVSKQDFDPWGKPRGTSTIAQTSLNYTGQRLDGTGLLYYHARYYDPILARFVSADTIVPGQADNAGTANPQALNRYSYVNNNPLIHTDPTGHCLEPITMALCIVAGVEAVEFVVTVLVGIIVIDGVVQTAQDISTPAYGSATDNTTTAAPVAPAPASDVRSGPLASGSGASTASERATGAANGEQGTAFQAKKAKQSGKEAKTDIPSWAKGTQKKPGESGKDAAKRVLDEKYGAGKYPTGPGSEYNQLKKYYDSKGK
jgi:RHS repeat-associated protein